MPNSIPLIVHIITSLTDGGAENCLYNIVRTDTQFRHVVISLVNAGKYREKLKHENIELHCLAMNSFLGIFFSLGKLYFILRCLKPNLVQTWMYHADLIGGIVAYIARVPKIVWGIRHSNLDAGKIKWTTKLIALACARLSWWIPNKIVCCAYKAAETHSKLGYVSSKMIIIENGIDTDVFRFDDGIRTEVRDFFEIEPRTFLIGMAARFDPQKDHINLINSLSLVKRNGISIHCLLFGEGIDYRNRLLTQKISEEQLANEISLLGSRDDVPRLLNALDLHVLSSLGEAFPNVVAEAMACGTLCVCTEVGDAPSLIGDLGWIVPPTNSAALAKAIENAFELKRMDNELWQSMRIQSRDAIVTQYGLANMLEKYDALWRSLQICDKGELI